MTSVLDGLTPTEYLVMEVLAARYRLGEDVWTFPSETVRAAKNLEAKGFVGWKSGVCENTLQLWLTDGGKAEMHLDRGYMTPSVPFARAWDPIKEAYRAEKLVEIRRNK